MNSNDKIHFRDLKRNELWVFNKSVCQGQSGFKQLCNYTMKLCKDVGIHP
jgi:hypothetical protein